MTRPRGPVVGSLTTSYRLSNARARDEIGWRPAHPGVDEGLAEAVAALRPGLPRSRPRDAAPSPHTAGEGRQR